MLMISIGFTIGFLSNNPDGLERVLIDHYGEDWLDNLASPWMSLLSWVTNDYFAGIIGILLTLGLIMSLFYFIKRAKKKDRKEKIDYSF
jgi:4-hydroxybenzoate polyprenyltransferase